jgi:2'-5' RNA ligase
MKRTFIAVRVDPGRELAGVIDTLKQELKEEQIKWVDKTKMHLTLAFIGETSENTIRDISGMLKGICSAKDKFEFEVSGLGLFRNINDPRVVWAGINDQGNLRALFSTINAGLEQLGIQTEEKDFKPHLTLGRIKRLKDKDTLEKLLTLNKATIFQYVEVKEVIYYESVLQQTGPLYIPIKVFKLS